MLEVFCALGGFSLEAADLQKMSALAVSSLHFLFDAVNKTPNASRLGYTLFVNCERKHSNTAFLYNVFFYIELNTTFRLFEVALKEVCRNVVSITSKKFLNSDRAVPWMCNVINAFIWSRVICSYS